MKDLCSQCRQEPARMKLTEGAFIIISSVIELSKTFSEYDFVRLPNMIEQNCSILFDYLRLLSPIKISFDYARLPIPGLTE